MATLQAVFAPPLTFAPGAVAGIPALRRVESPALTYYTQDSGSATVSGTVTMNAVPTARKVRLHTLNNGRLIREMWSDPVTGAYQFSNLKDQPYYVWSEDYARIYDPVSHLVTNTVG